jgi:ferric-chelate reductase
VVFLLGAKNSFLSWLLGPGRGYEKLNLLHRWVGRSIFIGALLHGTFWIIYRQRLQQISALGDSQGKSGLVALTLLCMIVLLSLRPIRRLFYQCFYFMQ